MLVSNTQDSTQHRTAHKKESFSQNANSAKVKQTNKQKKKKNLAVITQCMESFVPGAGRCRISLRQNCETVSCLFS